VAAFRHGLDVGELNLALEHSQKPRLFDLALAHELYRALLAPIDVLVKSKRHLLIVPTGPLTALPFHLLLTERPASPLPDFAGYREAAWLIKRHAVTVLPSVTSLKTLRVFAAKEHATLPMVGFGDPVFGPEPGETRAARAVPFKPRAYSDFWKGAGLDRDMLSRLPRLFASQD
jgi:CHAT domain-containing protein